MLSKALLRSRRRLVQVGGLLLAMAWLSGCASDTTDGTDEPAADVAATDAGTEADVKTATDVAATTDAGSTPQDTVTSAEDVASPVDTQTPPHDAGPTKPPVTTQKSITLPLGESLFFDGDDYLWSWGVTTKSVTLGAKPSGAKAEITGKKPGRLTPDVAGKWQVCRAKDDCIEVVVKADFLSEDTFLNYNYSPTTPLATIPTESGDPTEVWVTATTSNALQKVQIGKDKTKTLATYPVGSWPTAIAWAASQKVFLVTHCGRDSLGFFSPSEGRLIDAIAVGNEPANVVVDGEFAYVALSGEDKIAKVDLAKRELIGTVDVGRDPRAMTLDAKNKRLYVVSLLSSNAHPRGLLNKKDDELPEHTLRDVAAIDTDAFKVLGFAPHVGTILRGIYLLPGTDSKLVVAMSKARNNQAKIDKDSRPHQHALAIVDGKKVAAGKSGVDKVIDLDKLLIFTGPAPSPYTMQIGPGGHYLVVTLSAGKAVMFLDPKTYEERGRIPTGHDPRGLVIAHGRVWTYAWLSNALQGVEMPGKPTKQKVGLGGKDANEILWIPQPKLEMLSETIGNDPTPVDVKEGQRLFNDAAFSKHKDFSCNNCHIDGITDGLVWDLLVDGSVNTLAFRNVGGTGPFLWGGQLPTLFDFSREVLKLVGADATGKQMEQLTTYMQSVTAPPNPYTLPGGRMTKAGEEGAKIFYGASGAGGASCGDCHSGPLYTNTEVVDGKTKGKKTDVPSLLGVYDTGPWGRESQWSTLKEMTDFAAEFTGAKLNDDAKDKLLAFVRQLPGDRLYITSSLPLGKSKYVWPKTKVELQFSALLSPGQEGKFLFREVPKTGAPKAVGGTWTVSGRYARFKLAADLKKETKYEIAVGADVVGQLGEHLGGAYKMVFTTGATPELDVSGKFTAILQQSLIGTQKAEIAFLQATGGQVTGALLTKFQQGDVEKGSVEGHVSGKVLVLDPFYLDTSFGKFFVENGITTTCVDKNADKFADTCKGSFPFKFGGTTYTVNMTFNRLSLPKKDP